MTPPESDNEDAYNKLTTALHPSEEGAILEIAILPSYHTPEIHYDPDPEHPALALPKSLLIQLHLHARKTFFAYLASPIKERQETYLAALKASSVVLLWDPNHNTAANFRKSHIHALNSTWINNKCEEEDIYYLESAVQTEVYLLTSLLTSPLPKHPKSSTLWSHRYWLLQNFSALFLPLEDTSASNQETHPADADGARTRTRMGLDSDGVTKLWVREMDVVMRAGERHARNYYAWGYARQLLGFVEEKMDQCGEKGGVEWVEVGMGKVHKWCLMHPRDVSGWGFLVFLMQRVGDKESWGVSVSEGESEVKKVVWETREWVRKYEWRGESVEWFLKVVEQLQLG